VLVNADAKKIDYHIDTSIVVLTGNATTSKQGSGNASADHMVYNMTISPKKKP
jgi:lipopolysaccharide export system protein LptA